MSTKANASLDATETHWVEQSKSAANLTGRELGQLVRQLRERRERIKRFMRERARAARREGKPIADTGAVAKTSELVAAIARVCEVIEVRKPSNWDGKPVLGPTKPASGSGARPAAKAKPKAKTKAKTGPKKQAAPKPKTEAATKVKAATKAKPATKAGSKG